eukprot:2835102-Rhodomonas_salina.1
MAICMAAFPAVMCATVASATTVHQQASKTLDLGLGECVNQIRMQCESIKLVLTNEVLAKEAFCSCFC